MKRAHKMCDAVRQVRHILLNNIKMLIFSYSYFIIQLNINHNNLLFTIMKQLGMLIHT